MAITLNFFTMRNVHSKKTDFKPAISFSGVRIIKVTRAIGYYYTTSAQLSIMALGNLYK